MLLAFSESDREKKGSASGGGIWDGKTLSLVGTNWTETPHVIPTDEFDINSVQGDVSSICKKQTQGLSLTHKCKDVLAVDFKPPSSVSIQTCSRNFGLEHWATRLLHEEGLIPLKR